MLIKANLEDLKMKWNINDDNREFYDYVCSLSGAK